jgi:peptidoglycan/xylan/chitin deacetylase (PgdA/CDA1 family)
MKRLVAVVLLLFTLSLYAVNPGKKLIALTFDDGPRPYVLYGLGQETGHPTPSLLNLLDQQKVKATFFVMGWRLTPNTYGDPADFRTKTTCRDAAIDVARRGHEIENHTYSHMQLRLFEQKKGEASAMADVERGASIVKQVTGHEPRYLRAPDWIMPKDLERDIASHGFHVLTISAEMPMPVRDVNSADYLCTGKALKCPKPSLNDFVLREIEQREKKGITTHILAFHELSTTTVALQKLIPELKARGYEFVTLEQYFRLVSTSASAAAAK